MLLHILQSTTNSITTLVPAIGNNYFTKRSLFDWLTVIFNRVDYDRIKDVGPDRACAEWLLRNGAFVRWKGSLDYLKDYNVLIAQRERYYIEAVEAIDAGISYVGFPYFEGCKHIKEIKLINCRYIENKTICLLSVLKDSLVNLELINCHSVTNEGLYHLENLKLLLSLYLSAFFRKLQTLKLVGMPYLEEKDAVRKHLLKALPNVQIEFE